MDTKEYDVVVVGAGIIGLATAYVAAKQNLTVAVVERDPQNIAASIRNFGFVTVSGQRRGKHWQRALYTRKIWADIAPKAGIKVLHHGLHMLAQRQEALDVAHAFLTTEMGEGCCLLSAAEIAKQAPYLQAGAGVFYSPHELRIESKDAVGQLAKWLVETQGITFYNQTTVHAVELPNIKTSRGTLKAQKCIVCPGSDLSSLYPDVFAQAKAKLCTLNMLRVMPEKPFQLNAAVMSDLSFARYDGFAQLPEGQKLGQLLDKEQVNERKTGVHLIVVQSADGSLVIGDSHDYANRELPFRDTYVDDLILQEFQRIMNIGKVTPIQHWLGVYPSADDVVFMASPEPGVVVGTITGGTGASTCFAFAEELVTEVFAS